MGCIFTLYNNRCGGDIGTTMPNTFPHHVLTPVLLLKYSAQSFEIISGQIPRMMMEWGMVLSYRNSLQIPVWEEWVFSSAQTNDLQNINSIERVKDFQPIMLTHSINHYIRSQWRRKMCPWLVILKDWTHLHALALSFAIPRCQFALLSHMHMSTLWSSASSTFRSFWYTIQWVFSSLRPCIRVSFWGRFFFRYVVMKRTVERYIEGMDTSFQRRSKAIAMILPRTRVSRLTAIAARHQMIDLQLNVFYVHFYAVC